MTETYDSLKSSNSLFTLGYIGGRSIEAIDHGGYFYVMVYIDTNEEMIYAYGDTNSWTTQALTGATSTTGYNIANVTDCALAIDHNNDEVHIAWIADNKVWHMKCTDPDAPTVLANWQTYGANKYQQVDNDSANTKGSVSICVDDAGGVANGADDPHIVWSDDMSGTPDVYYNWGDGIDDLFTQADELKIADGEQPTITNIHDEGRRVYIAFVDSTETRVDFIVHDSINDPTTLANWAGPVTGTASTADPALSMVVGHNAIEAPLMTWWWDGDELLLITALSTGALGTTPKTIIFDSAATTLLPEHSVEGYVGTAESISCTQVMSDDFRVFVQAGGPVYYSREAATVANDFEWSDTSDWFELANTISGSVVGIQSEWKGMEHADGGLGYRRTHCLFVTGIGDIYFSEARENTPIINELNAPTPGANKDETAPIDIVWSNTDYEVDGQTNFSLQVDDDPNFGSPIIDDVLTASASTTRTIAADTLTAGKIYYWRTRTMDGEKGDEQDPHSHEDWKNTVSESDGTLRWFYTASQLVIYIDAVEQQSDNDVYIDMRLSSSLSINAELDDGGAPSTDFAQYRTTGGSWTNLDVIIGESTGDPIGPLTTSPTGTFYRLAWDAEADEATYEGLVDIRIRGQYENDVKSLGFTDWEEFTDVPVDNLAPTVTVGVPDTLIIVEKTPTLHCSGTDFSGIEYQFEIDDNGSYTTPESSGWQDGNSYRVVTPLTAGLWYFHAKGRDKSVCQNEGSWDEGTFTIAASSYVGTVLSDGDNDISLNIIDSMVFSIHNSVIEYDNILNDYNEVGVNQNLVEMRGRLPLEVSMALFFNTGFDAGDDTNRLFEWKRNNTKLSLESIDGKMVTFGDEDYEEYAPNRWVILSIKPTYNPARTDSIHLNVKLREVEP